MTQTKPATVNPPCSCGCGEQVGSRGSRFRPGHDARMVSEALLAVFEQGVYLGVDASKAKTPAAAAARISARIAKISGPLQVKFDRAVERRLAVEAERQAKAEGA